MIMQKSSLAAFKKGSLLYTALANLHSSRLFLNLYQFDEHVEVITIDELLVERFNREAKDFNSLVIDISLNKEWIYPLLAAYPCEQQIDISNNSNLSIRIGKVDVHFKGSLSHQLGEWSIYSLDANSLKITTSITKNYYLVHSDQAKFWGLIDSFDVLYRIHPIAFLAVKEAGLILEKIIFKSSSRLPKHIFDIGEARPEVVFGNQIFENENFQAIQHSSEKVYL